MNWSHSIWREGDNNRGRGGGGRRSKRQKQAGLNLLRDFISKQNKVNTLSLQLPVEYSNFNFQKETTAYCCKNTIIKLL